MTMPNMDFFEAVFSWRKAALPTATALRTEKAVLSALASETRRNPHVTMVLLTPQ
jgi:hypothetical protein